MHRNHILKWKLTPCIYLRAIFRSLFVQKKTYFTWFYPLITENILASCMGFQFWDVVVKLGETHQKLSFVCFWWNLISEIHFLNHITMIHHHIENNWGSRNFDFLMQGIRIIPISTHMLRFDVITRFNTSLSRLAIFIPLTTSEIQHNCVEFMFHLTESR